MTPQQAAAKLVSLNREKLEPLFLRVRAAVYLETFAAPSVYSNGNAYVKAAVEWLSAAQQLFAKSGEVLASDPAGAELDAWFKLTHQQVAYLQENNIRGADPANAFLAEWVKGVVAEIWEIVKLALGTIDAIAPNLKWAALAAAVLLVVIALR